jgi:hypothetical protein
MNAANIIPIGAPHAGQRAKSEHPVALNPVRVRLDGFNLDEPNALLLRNGKAVALAPKPFGVAQPEYATANEVRYAHELRLPLRARLLRNAEPQTGAVVCRRRLICAE